ncbi:hypothetical protein ABI_35060 [Asticcacaulis biprosthecium C19]|uniref:Tetratricopeptide repeat family protein n=1 Tax=Asticcacaulis biprosthecium C19 TaxID=715226 RepID=F4QQJ6_9CAUL|nr:hypothetical protein [Asticcacaulis biprosthecium]EGF90483.1 hypothetical protein ABI_35060 [Asticcacaulis biprosthecium C19]
MSFTSKALAAAVTAATCFTPIMVQAQAAIDPSAFVKYLRESGRVDEGLVGPPAIAGSAGALPATGGVQTDAAAAATDSAGATGTCDSHFTRSQALSTDLSAGFAAMSSKDPKKMAEVLPALQRQLDALPAAEIRPEVCNANHINAYTTYQNVQLSLLRDKGIDTGFPANLPLVKQPELNQSTLAYAVGWIKYEQGDFPGALAAFNKGLIMFPHYHPLQHEYLLTLVQLKNGAGVVAYAEKVLTQTHDLDDTMRGKIWAAHGMGLIMTGQAKQADDSFTVSLRYNYDQSIADLQAAIRKAAGQ